MQAPSTLPACGLPLESALRRIGRGLPPFRNSGVRSQRENDAQDVFRGQPGLNGYRGFDGDCIHYREKIRNRLLLQFGAFARFEGVHGWIKGLHGSAAVAYPARLADLFHRGFEFFGSLLKGHVRTNTTPEIRLVKPPRFRHDRGMCGRYRLTNAERYSDLNDVRLGGTDVPAQFNIAPTQTVFVVLDESPKEFSAVKWGLIPSWAKDRKIASSLINARCETVGAKPAFRSAFKKRRCLVPADGFFEWQKRGAAKQPFNIGLKGDEPFAFAGLWEAWKEPETGEWLRTCSIITTTPNELTAPIHDRMPVILPMNRRAAWLDPGSSGEELQSFLVPYPASEMEAYPISSRVGSPRNNDAGIIERLATTGDFLKESFPDPL